MDQSSYSFQAVQLLVRGNQPALRAMGGGSSSVIQSVVKLSIRGRAVKQKPKIWVDSGVGSKSIRELIASHRGPTLEEKYLEVLLNRKGSPVGDPTLLGYVSWRYFEDFTSVEAEITDAFILGRWFSSDWGRISGDGIGQGVCRKRRSPVQNFCSSGRTPVQRWNRHG
ncbi:hypothetical protein [Laspinema olomoucense]|uniref:hypothetical protein n=1 Tax=Laspinema olomoucense TaxID=3231600 RepID=UPI0021BBAD2F|nr:hypothetical protein [Laspinema sp. D3d]MCT7974595.1 hypothetical protein [Laspinema sp. D3d]